MSKAAGKVRLSRRSGPIDAVDGPWMPMDMEIVKAAGQKRLDFGKKQIEVCDQKYGR